MTFSDEHPEIDRQALAEQVIVSAGNMLATAGFGREEIADFFRQAANQIAPAPDFDRPASVAPSVDALSAFRAAFASHPAIRELQDIAASQDLTSLKDAFDKAMRLAPQIAEAQHALRKMAKEAELPIFATAEEQADTDEAGEAAAIVLEEFEPHYSGAFDLIANVLGELADRNDREAFSFLLAHLADHGVVINRPLQAAIESGARALDAQG